MKYTKENIKSYILYNQNLFSHSERKMYYSLKDLMDCICRMGVIQIDSINVVERSHYLTLWSRLGFYNKSDLDSLIYGEQKQLFEYWFHCASLIPLNIYKYLADKMDTYKNNNDKWSKEWLSQPENLILMKQVYEHVKSHGNVRSADFDEEKPIGGWWNRKPTKNALEQLYNRGDLMVTDRVNFCRIYDIKERVLPNWVDKSQISFQEAIAFKLTLSAKCLGVFFLQELMNYANIRKSSIEGVLASIIKKGEIIPIEVAEFREPMYIHKEKISDLSNFTEANIDSTWTTFLSPFDCIFWNKKRNRVIFDFENVFEAYKPEKSRKWGYYNMPILYRGNFIGRIDPKVDRQSKKLILKSIFLEKGIKISESLIKDISRTLADFQRFNNANSIEIHFSNSDEFRRKLIKSGI
ncbi:hypothetical protein AHMF7605_20885 [Adhaeribacter arboris]|uniref:Winged helix-turn-helix domain-containing protein n=1 Tax=Adhaeribacter arboris TaxID=2072846 RepID=A0A2T2YJW3_9BACT|nr:crosslink repair DNA glycosylase YcaQ family protein [Adhaeribacter arboris]PSR55779.1 hypothetical protein AHMF7605_20885 [Adhaeribacter arboris]